MLDILHQALYDLRGMLFDASLQWNTLDVLYDTPRVERLWLPYNKDYRIYLHVIHPCEKPFFHPHPWPSAVKILYGTYKMDVGYSVDGLPPSVASTVVLTEGSEYEMVDPNGWHSVNPLGGFSYSVMVSGKPYNTNIRKIDYSANQPLAQQRADSIRHAFMSVVFHRHYLFGASTCS